MLFQQFVSVYAVLFVPFGASYEFNVMDKRTHARPLGILLRILLGHFFASATRLIVDLLAFVAA